MKNVSNVIVNNDFNNIEIVGGKGWNLNILKENNINVPKFFVISSELYELYLSGTLDLVYMENSINEYCNNNFEKDTLFAIRSSANIEDSNNMSYAGQFESFLNVRQEDIFECVLEVWKSGASLGKGNGSNFQDFGNRNRPIFQVF